MGNLVTQLMKKPQYEDPIDTARLLVEQNITLLVDNRVSDNYKSHFLSLNNSIWNEVADLGKPSYSKMLITFI